MLKPHTDTTMNVDRLYQAGGANFAARYQIVAGTAAAQQAGESDDAYAARLIRRHFVAQRIVAEDFAAIIAYNYPSEAR